MPPKWRLSISFNLKEEDRWTSCIGCLHIRRRLMTMARQVHTHFFALGRYVSLTESLFCRFSGIRHLFLKSFLHGHNLRYRPVSVNSWSNFVYYGASFVTRIHTSKSSHWGILKCWRKSCLIQRHLNGM